MFVRVVIGALDRHHLGELIGDVPGTSLGGFEPADADDERVEPLTDRLTGTHWRGRALDRLCGEIVDALEVWRCGRAKFDAGLRSLLDSD
jgi:hypothetical protein